LKDDFGFPIRPANLAAGQFKSGARVEDIYRTISTGLAGTPMPTFRDAFPDQDRWALAYYVLSLSAYKDPLSGQALPLSEADRQVLDDPHFETESPENAYVPRGEAIGKPPVERNKKLASDFAKRKPGMLYDEASESSAR
jgi:cytochrome c oxidase cbb3-type subunit 2